MQENINVRRHKVITSVICFAKSREKAARLEQTRLEERSENIGLPKETEVNPNT